MKKALLICDAAGEYASRPEAVAEVLRDIYDGMYEIDCTQDYETLAVERLRQYHTIILTAAQWDLRASRRSVAALLQYTVSGGTILAIGDFLKNEGWYELDCLFAKRWIGGSTPCLLDLSADGRHPVTAGTEPFKLVEYTNFYELDPILQPQIALHLNYAGKQYPVAWCHGYGWGKVMCITVGNIPESYLPQLRRILWRCGEWFLNRL